MSQVQAHRSTFADNRVSPIIRIDLQQLGAKAQRLIGGMSHTEHPLITVHGADTATHLVCECLKSEPIIGGGEPTADPIVRPLLLLHREKLIDGLLETTVQQQLVTGTGQARRVIRLRMAPARQVRDAEGSLELRGKVETMNAV